MKTQNLSFIFLILTLFFLSGCSNSNYGNYSSTSSSYCDDECKEQKCETAKLNKIREIQNENDKSWTAYENGEDNRSCPKPSYLGSYYVYECGYHIKPYEIWSCPGQTVEAGMRTKLLWDTTACAFNCTDVCVDEKYCGSIGQKALGWFQDLDFGWGDSNDQETNNNKSKVKSTTKCKTVASQLWCTTTEH